MKIKITHKKGIDGKPDEFPFYINGELKATFFDHGVAQMLLRLIKEDNARKKEITEVSDDEAKNTSDQAMSQETSSALSSSLSECSISSKEDDIKIKIIKNTVSVKKIVWNYSYMTCGNKILDDQHRQLIDYINDLVTIYNCNEYITKELRASIHNIYAQLIEYTARHFSDEEKLLAKYNWNELAAHKKLHSDFIANLHGLKEKFSANEGAGLASLLYFLTVWLEKHILVSDKKYGKIINHRDVP